VDSLESSQIAIVPTESGSRALLKFGAIERRTNVMAKAAKSAKKPAAKTKKAPAKKKK
jgi:hypothetical protein